MLPGSVKIVGFQSSLKTFLHMFSLIGSGYMWIQLFMSKVNGENLLFCHSCCLLPNLHPVIPKGAPKQFYVSSFSDILSISPNEQNTFLLGYKGGYATLAYRDYHIPIWESRH